MSRRGENIRKRKDGRWEGRVKTNGAENSKPKYKSIYGKTYNEVKQKMRDFNKEDFYSYTKNKKDITFGEVLDQWRKLNKLKQKDATEYKYGYLIDRHIKPSLQNIKMGKMNSGILNEFLLDKLCNGRIDNKGGLSASYVRTMMIIINSSLDYSYEQGYSQMLKVKGFSMPNNKKPPATLTLHEQQTLEKYIFDNPIPTNLGILLALRAGLRVGEVCALSWDDVDLSKKIIHVRSTVVRTNNKFKGSSSFRVDVPKTKTSIRDIPISGCLFAMMKTIRNHYSSPYVISDNNTFIKPNTFEYRYHNIMKTCKIRNVNFHALRHTFATRCIEAGMDDKTLSEILGHANVSITLNTYVHSSMQLKRAQMQKLSELINDGQ